MKLSKFETSIFLGLGGGWIQLMCGMTHHAFYTLGVMIVIILLGIMEYTKQR